ncbi:MAG: hypothetical protein VX293_04045 [Candidatus Latescibacterota bacterium]|nr:hypothetical protein [Candidatus Latescibacterota bacterium]
MIDEVLAWCGSVFGPVKALSDHIDFEFAHWDVPTADFTRYPSWNWIERPDLTEAFFAGYGPLTPEAEQQRLVALATYAVSAIVWGSDNDYHGFAREGREALVHLAGQLA